MSGKLKYVRIIISLYFFLILTATFIGIPAIATGRVLTESTTFFQFVPSVLRSTLIPVAAIGFIFVLLLTIFFGRIYCSTICPLGFLQDIIARIGKRFSKIKIFRYSKAYNYLRYGILILVILSLFAGTTFLLNLLDPYSNFGKIWSGLFRPLVVTINDLLSGLLEKTGSYIIKPIGIVSFNWPVLVYPFVFLCTIIFLAYSRGRLFCNTICPVGTLLSIVSKISFFKLTIDENTCTRCGKCSTACKAECIDVKIKKVEFDRCVACFNCIKACPENGIGYKKFPLSFLKLLKNKQFNSTLTDFKINQFLPLIPKRNWLIFQLSPFRVRGKKAEKSQKNLICQSRIKNATDINSSDQFLKINTETAKQIATIQLSGDRRKFLHKSLFLLFAAGLMTIKSKASAVSGVIAFKKKHAVTPPGSYQLANFSKHCTACHLCVSACPTQVLQPASIQYGIEGIFQPFMDYDKSYCNYECVKCSEVCPTGAILPIKTEQKKTIQIGQVIFLKNNCIVYTEEKSCGACSEHCPTKAVRMISYKGALTIPETDASICVGCGACEYACPAEPYKAIYVEGNLIHQTAFKYKEEKNMEKTPQDFPF